MLATLGLCDSPEISLTGLEESKALSMIEDEALKLAKNLTVFLEYKLGFFLKVVWEIFRRKTRIKSPRA